MFSQGTTKGMVALLLVGSLGLPDSLVAKKPGMQYTMKYEGGSLPFKQHKKLKVWLQMTQLIIKLSSKVKRKLS